MTSGITEGARGNSDSDVLDVVLLAAASASVTLLLTVATGLRFAHASSFLGPIGGIVAVFAALNLYQYVRLPDNKRTIFLLNILIIYFIMSAVLVIYQYALALLPAYPISQFVHRSDELVGFSWIEFSMRVHRIPYLSETFGFCYKNWIRETFLVVMILSITRNFDRLKEFSVAYIFTSMAAITISGFFYSQSYDALAAYATPGAHLPTGFTHEVFDKAEGLRQGRDHTLDFARLIGLVCFPSFHAGAAVLLATATRGVRFLWPAFLAFNVFVLLGTLTEGGHNLADVVAGCVIAVAATAAAKVYLRWGLAARPLASAVERLALRPAASNA